MLAGETRHEYLLIREQFPQFDGADSRWLGSVRLQTVQNGCVLDWNTSDLDESRNVVYNGNAVTVSYPNGAAGGVSLTERFAVEPGNGGIFWEFRHLLVPQQQTDTTFTVSDQYRITLHSCGIREFHLTYQPEDGICRTVKIQMFGTEPLADMISDHARFIAEKQFESDESDPCYIVSIYTLPPMPLLLFGVWVYVNCCIETPILRDLEDNRPNSDTP